MQWNSLLWESFRAMLFRPQCALKSTIDSVKMHCLTQWDLRFCISHSLPDNAVAAGLWLRMWVEKCSGDEKEKLYLFRITSWSTLSMQISLRFRLNGVSSGVAHNQHPENSVTSVNLLSVLLMLIKIQGYLCLLLLTILQLYHLPPPLSPPVSNSFCLFPQCQPLYASCCTVLLYFSRYCTVRLKMFSLKKRCKGIIWFQKNRSL